MSGISETKLNNLAKILSEQDPDEKTELSEEEQQFLERVMSLIKERKLAMASEQKPLERTCPVCEWAESDCVCKKLLVMSVKVAEDIYCQEAVIPRNLLHVYQAQSSRPDERIRAIATTIEPVLKRCFDLLCEAQDGLRTSHNQLHLDCHIYRPGACGDARLIQDIGKAIHNLEHGNEGSGDVEG